MRISINVMMLLGLWALGALGQARPSSPVDGGPAPARGASDAGIRPDSGVGPTEDQARASKELIELKLRVDELERQQAKVSAQLGHMDRLTKQVEEMKAQLKTLGEAEERRVAVDGEALAKKAVAAQASVGMRSILQQLSTGDTSGVERTLRSMEGLLEAPARQQVELARMAVQQGDVAAARRHLSLAILEVEGQR